jgi:hypothetical protein
MNSSPPNIVIRSQLILDNVEFAFCQRSLAVFH